MNNETHTEIKGRENNGKSRKEWQQLENEIK
jgi:hypothetical protein